MIKSATPGGATGSSYATAGGGLAAYSALLSHYHYGVERQRGSIAQHQPPDNATVFVLEPSDLTVDDASALLQFAIAGGRLVVGGESPFYLRSLRDTAPQWQPAGTTSWTTVDPSLGNQLRGGIQERCFRLRSSLSLCPRRRGVAERHPNILSGC